MPRNMRIASTDGMRMYALFKQRTGIVDVLHQQSVEIQSIVFGNAVELLRDEVVRLMPLELKHHFVTIQQTAAANNNNDKLFNHLLGVVLGWDENRNVMVYGRTQAGKTSIKALLAVICQCNNIPVIVVTTQCSEARELSTKLQNWTGKRDHVYCAADRRTKYGQEALIRKSIISNGILVLASTSSTQLAISCKILHQYQTKAPWPGARTFALVMDESDAVCRSDKSALAKQIAKIQRLKPCVSVCMTATPFPSWLLGTGTKDSSAFVNFCLPPSEQYMPLEDMVPFQNEKKNQSFYHETSLIRAAS